MSEQKTNNYAGFEDSINKFLSGDARQNALSFVQHLASLGVTFGDDGGSRPKYKGVTMCDLHIDGETGGYPGPWTIWIYWIHWTHAENIPNDEHFKDIIWANIDYCRKCHGGNTEWCKSDKKKTIFGRDFDNVCQSAIAFTDPDAEAVECAKKLMNMIKHAIDARVATT